MMSPNGLRRTVFIAVAVIYLTACDRQIARYSVPAGAGKSSAGWSYVLIRKTAGVSARDGGIWGIEWKLISHKKRGCAYPCTEYLLVRPSDTIMRKWRDIMQQMHEGETCRVWVHEASRVAVYDVTLDQVIKADASGKPLP